MACSKDRSNPCAPFLGPDEGHHRIKLVTARNIELINAFIKVHQDISVVQRNFEHRNGYVKEKRSVQKQLPVFVTPIKDTTINEGAKYAVEHRAREQGRLRFRFTFECIIDGSEPINVTWLKEQTILSSATHDIHYDRGLATLTLVNVHRDDSAYYTCRAANTAGTVENSAYLVVKGKYVGSLFPYPVARRIPLTLVRRGTVSLVVAYSLTGNKTSISAVEQ